jgi:hypothetical protein
LIYRGLNENYPCFNWLFILFFAPKTLVRQSFNGTLLQIGVRLPSQAIDEISINIFDTYQK